VIGAGKARLHCCCSRNFHLRRIAAAGRGTFSLTRRRRRISGEDRWAINAAYEMLYLRLERMGQNDVLSQRRWTRTDHQTSRGASGAPGLRCLFISAATRQAVERVAASACTPA